MNIIATPMKANPPKPTITKVTQGFRERRHFKTTCRCNNCDFIFPYNKPLSILCNFTYDICKSITVLIGLGLVNFQFCKDLYSRVAIENFFSLNIFKELGIYG